jgi:hypothetical protein
MPPVPPVAIEMYRGCGPPPEQAEASAQTANDVDNNQRTGGLYGCFADS